MRVKLKEVRKRAGLTQQQVADKIGISLRYYKAIEAGSRLGSIANWDALESLLNVHQRLLRQDFPAQADSQSKRPEDRQS